MNYIQNYVELMNLRYDFTITLSVQIPENLYRQDIPKMSLQPIVEMQSHMELRSWMQTRH